METLSVLGTKLLTRWEDDDDDNHDFEDFYEDDEDEPKSSHSPISQHLDQAISFVYFLVQKSCLANSKI